MPLPFMDFFVLIFSFLLATGTVVGNGTQGRGGGFPQWELGKPRQDTCGKGGNGDGEG